jgi:predicted transcriptional regulator
MAFRMEKTLRFWVNCEYERRKFEASNRARFQAIAEILREHEEEGHAMRYLDVEGEISWKASPSMLSKLADLQRDAEEDLADWP